MRNGRIGGGLVIGGWALVVLGMAASWVVGSTIGNAIVMLALAVVGAGAAILAAAGPAPLQGRVVRIGLAFLAVGLIAVACSAVAAARLTYDALEDAPTVVLLLGGGLATAIGMLLTQVSLVRAGGLARKLGGMFFLGLAGIYLLQVIASVAQDVAPVKMVAIVLSVVAAAAFAIGCAAPGLLAALGARGVPAATR